MYSYGADTSSGYWNAADSATAYSTLAGVAAGFVLVGISIIYATEPKADRWKRLPTLVLFGSAFFVFLIDSFLFGLVSDDGGVDETETVVRAGTEAIAAAGLLGVGGVHLFVGLAWLLNYHEGDETSRYLVHLPRLMARYTAWLVVVLLWVGTFGLVRAMFSNEEPQSWAFLVEVTKWGVYLYPILIFVAPYIVWLAWITIRIGHARFVVRGDNGADIARLLQSARARRHSGGVDWLKRSWKHAQSWLKGVNYILANGKMRQLSKEDAEVVEAIVDPPQERESSRKETKSDKTIRMYREAVTQSIVGVIWTGLFAVVVLGIFAVSGLADPSIWEDTTSGIRNIIVCISILATLVFVTCIVVLYLRVLPDITFKWRRLFRIIGLSRERSGTDRRWFKWV